MGRMRRTLVVVILLVVAGLTALLGLPFIAPIVDAIARRNGPRSGQVHRTDAASVRVG